MKKIVALVLSVCFIFASAPAFAESQGGGGTHTKGTHGGHMGAKSTQHGQGKMRAKSTQRGKAHTKSTRTRAAQPGMPKTGMGGASEE